MTGFEVGAAMMYLGSDYHKESLLGEHRSEEAPDMLLVAIRRSLQMKRDIAKMKSENRIIPTDAERDFIEKLDDSTDHFEVQDQFTMQEDESEAVPAEVPKESESFSISWPIFWSPLTGFYKITICN